MNERKEEWDEDGNKKKVNTLTKKQTRQELHHPEYTLLTVGSIGNCHQTFAINQLRKICVTWNKLVHSNDCFGVIRQFNIQRKNSDDLFVEELSTVLALSASAGRCKILNATDRVEDETKKREFYGFRTNFEIDSFDSNFHQMYWFSRFLKKKERAEIAMLVLRHAYRLVLGGCSAGVCEFPSRLCNIHSRHQRWLVSNSVFELSEEKKIVAYKILNVDDQRIERHNNKSTQWK